MFYYYSIKCILEILRQNTNYTLITIDKSIVGKRGIIDHIEKAIQSPYIRDNWDGFEEAIGDLCWMEDPHIKIIHLELPSLSEKDMAIYLGILKDAYKYWSMAPPLDVEVIFTDELKITVENFLLKLNK